MQVGHKIFKYFLADNPKGTHNAKSIKKTFSASSLVGDVNNDMNSIFSKDMEKYIIRTIT